MIYPLNVSYCYTYSFVESFFFCVCVQMAMSMYYRVEYTIQETTCPSSAEAADKCPLMSCEFAVSHDKSLFHSVFEHFILLEKNVEKIYMVTLHVNQCFGPLVHSLHLLLLKAVFACILTEPFERHNKMKEQFLFWLSSFKCVINQGII